MKRSSMLWRCCRPLSRDSFCAFGPYRRRPPGHGDLDASSPSAAEPHVARVVTKSRAALASAASPRAPSASPPRCSCAPAGDARNSRRGQGQSHSAADRRNNDEGFRLLPDELGAARSVALGRLVRAHASVGQAASQNPRRPSPPRRTGLTQSRAEPCAPRPPARASRSVIISSLHLEGHVWKPSFVLQRRVPARTRRFTSSL
jgi:hypothetical protein